MQGPETEDCSFYSPVWLPILWREPSAPSKGEILAYAYADSWGSGKALAEDDCRFSPSSPLGATTILHRHPGVVHAPSMQATLGEGTALKHSGRRVFINVSFEWTFFYMSFLASRTVTLGIGVQGHSRI